MSIQQEFDKACYENNILPGNPVATWAATWWGEKLALIAESDPAYQKCLNAKELRSLSNNLTNKEK